MAIPKYDDMTLPILKILSDGQEHTVSELAERMAKHFNLSPEEQSMTLPSSNATYLKVRAGWAAFGLRKAGLAAAPKQATIQITEEGQRFLITNPTGKLDRTALKKFDAFRAWASEVANRAVATRREAISGSPAQSASEEETTPQERIESAYGELKETLLGDLRAKLTTINPFRFEQVVLDLLVAMGYGGSKREAAEVTQKTSDHGIDGVINEDRLGLDVIYVQAKRWQNNIGRPEIQNFVGALAGKKASKGIFITTSNFHENARDYAAALHQKVILVDGRRLAELMIEHNIGVALEQSYVVKKIDSDYFEEA